MKTLYPRFGRPLFVGLFFCFCLVESMTHAESFNYREILALGDSFTDTGNLFEHCEGSRFGPPYYEGRGSNGETYIEHLAKGLGLKVPEPSIRGGTNYAFGGATSGHDYQDAKKCGAGGVGVKEIPSVGNQIEQYIKDSNGEISPDTLVVLFCGGNDLRHLKIYDIPYNIEKHIRKLADIGAKHILVFNLPPFGSFPVVGGYISRISSLINREMGTDYGTETYRYGLGWTEYLGAMISNSFIRDCRNSILDQLLNQAGQDLGINIMRFDTYSFFEDVFSNPEKYGIRYIVDPAYDIYNEEIHPEAEDFMFWDYVHLTRKGHQILGEAVLDFVLAHNNSTSFK